MPPKVTRHTKQRKLWIQEVRHLITPLNDSLDTRDFKYFGIAGIDADKLSLAIWYGGDSHYWALSCYQDGQWQLCGNLKTVLPELNGCKTSWRNDLCKTLTWGFQSPIEWLHDVIEKHSDFLLAS